MRGWLLAALFLAGCAGLDDVGCRHANWYDLGFRDAIFGIAPQHDLYELQCQAHGVKVDMARYRQGWREGRYEADTRNPGSAD